MENAQCVTMFFIIFDDVRLVKAIGRSQIGGFLLAEQAGQNAGPFIFAAHRHLVFAFAGTLAGPLPAARRHRQRGRSVGHRRRLFERIDVRVNCMNPKYKQIHYTFSKLKFLN